MYGMWRPALRYQALQLSSGISQYLVGVNLGMYGQPGTVVDVSFVEQNPVPTELFYGNLIDPAPLFRTGVDEYDTFLRWRKTWARVTSVRPDWLYDEVRQALMIHNPISRYHCGVTVYSFWPIERLNVYGSDWVKKYALAKARYTYGEILAKFNHAVPGPVREVTMDSTKRDRAQVELDKLEATLKASCESTPIGID